MFSLPAPGLVRFHEPAAEELLLASQHHEGDLVCLLDPFPGEHFLRPSQARLGARGEKKEKIRIALREIELVEGIQEAEAVCTDVVAQVFHDPILLRVLQGKDRLIHQENRRAVEKAERQDGALELSFAHFLRPAVEELRQLEDVDQLPHKIRALVLPDPPAVHFMEKLPDGLFRFELEVLVDNGSDPVAVFLVPKTGSVLSAETDCSSRGKQGACRKKEERGFPAAVLAHQGSDPGGQIQRQVGEDIPAGARLIIVVMEGNALKSNGALCTRIFPPLAFHAEKVYPARMSRKARVGVVFGGRSAEHEISLLSAKNVLDALDPAKYEPVLIGVDRDGRWYRQAEARLLLDASRSLPRSPSLEVALVARGEQSALLDLSGTGESEVLDVVFPVLHGPYGEDGSIQGLCKLANLPCVGAGVLGSAVGMDKDVLKRLLRDAGIPIPRFMAAQKENVERDFRKVTAVLGSPVFVKPANLGSSVGVSMAADAEEYERALAEAFRYDRKVIIEERIEGREIECSVLGNGHPVASVPGEIRTGSGHAFYDYEAKYIDENGAELLIPAPLDAGTADRVRELAVRAFSVLCCDGMARVDMFLRNSVEVLVNEINTIPGFTRISMYPKLWEATGISYRDLVDRLIQLALERHAAERGLATTR